MVSSQFTCEVELFHSHLSSSTYISHFLHNHSALSYASLLNSIFSSMNATSMRDESEIHEMVIYSLHKTLHNLEHLSNGKSLKISSFDEKISAVKNIGFAILMRFTHSRSMVTIFEWKCRKSLCHIPLSSRQLVCLVWTCFQAAVIFRESELRTSWLYFITWN